MAGTGSMNLVPCVKWTRRGVAKAKPDKVELNKEELAELVKKAQDDLENMELLSEEDEVEPTVSDSVPDSATRKRSRASKNADDESEHEEDQADLADPIKGLGGLIYHVSNDDDPYVTLKEEPESDEEDLNIREDDNMLLVGRVHRDSANLEVWVYNEKASQLYIHHDVLLPSFPVCVEWLRYNPARQQVPGNLAAVGTMTAAIDLWDLDLVNSLEPACTLGVKVKSSKKKLKKKQGMLGHTDAVISLAWNTDLPHVLASGSADCTLGFWDLATAEMSTQLNPHKDKVQCLQWHAEQSHVLLSGSSDKTCHVTDCRNNRSVLSVQADGEVECLSWNHFSSHHFLVGSDTGHVFYYDMRQSSQPLFTLAAHFKPVTSLCLSSQVPGLLLSASQDGTVKIWDILEHRPEQVLSKDQGVGQLFDVQCCPEAPFTFCVGGEQNLNLWDVSESVDVRRRFKKRPQKSLIPLDDDDEVSDETKAKFSTKAASDVAKKMHKAASKPVAKDADPETHVEEPDSDEESSGAVATAKSKKVSASAKLPAKAGSSAALAQRKRRRKKKKLVNL